MKTENTAKFIESMKASSSYLFVGADETRAEEYINDIICAKKIRPEEVTVIRPEVKNGKNKYISVEQARGLVHDINITPSGPLRFAAVAGAERMNDQAANTLLKSLEEPPSHALLVLFTSSDNMLATIKSRCKVLYAWELDQKVSGETVDILDKYFFEQVKLVEKAAKEEGTADLLSEILSAARIKMLSAPTLKNAEFVKACEATRKKISQNANARVQIENLLLKYKGH